MIDAVILPQEGAESHMEADAEASFLLTSLEVFNWGPFQGKHRCEIDPHGSAIIGPTGSGKTTLVDALMTLLAPLPKYNLASTGGHESDRDLISYIRGFPVQKAPRAKTITLPARQDHDRHCRHLHWRWSAGHPWFDSVGGWQQ